MASMLITPLDVIEARKAYPSDERILKFNTDEAKPNKDKNTFYAPCKFRTKDDKWTYLNLTFKNQVLAGNARIPHKVELKNAKDVRIAFMKLEEKNFDGTEYTSEKVKVLLKANKEFIQALDIINDEYALIVKDMIKNDSSFLPHNKTINYFKQSERKDDKLKKKVALERAIYRVKITADCSDPSNRRLGYVGKNGFSHIIFDTKKAILDLKKRTEEAKAKGLDIKKIVARNIPASIKTAEGNLDLTIENCKYFLSYMSTVSGCMPFDSLCASGQGLSLQCKIRELHVMHHKSMKVAAIDTEAMMDMADGMEDADEETVQIAEPDEKTPKKSSPKAKSKPTSAKAAKAALQADTEVDLDEPNENTGEEHVEDPDEHAETTEAVETEEAQETHEDTEEPAEHAAEEAEEAEPAAEEAEEAEEAEDFVEVEVKPAPKPKAAPKKAEPVKKAVTKKEEKPAPAQVPTKKIVGGSLKSGVAKK